MERTRTYYIKLAGMIALFGNLALCAVKLSLASMSGSLAVMGDGIDSATDSLIALVTILISRIISRPSDKEHPWGHGRAETVATMILSFVIFFAGAQLLLSSAGKLLHFREIEPPESDALAIIAASISIAGKSLLTASQFALGKKSQSPMVMANAKNMKSDILMSAAVLAGLVLSKVFALPVLDPVAALLISVCVIKSAAEIFLETNRELMDGNTDDELYRSLFRAAMEVSGVSNPHRARIRKISSHYDIDLDIEVDAGMTVHEAHEIAEQVEDAVKAAIPDVYDIMVHVEPAGHAGHHPAEQFGISMDSVGGGKDAHAI
ncbi:MAG: cation transporter [Treponema sp.]|uniref:cation diffusion facilitator family transporter n=1 Tax=Treponema sp. TaxID=166 RepID=UPI00257A8DDE|nr:cation diffusion facilitator family transporter [Treponema sp.]MBQ5537455.1 cation transporter [Treponema sp.]